MIAEKILLAKSIKNIYQNNLSGEIRISTDSRKIAHGDFFVALVGDNFDAYTYIDQVIEMGASGVAIIDEASRQPKILEIKKKYPKLTIIGVSDSLMFLQEIAHIHLLSWKSSQTNSEKKVIGVTGSNGKTTHKEMLSYLLNTLFPGAVLATKGNLNNHIGVPLTLLDLKDHHNIAIIEMGMNHRGEIKALCDIAMPEHGMITNIGAAHIEFLKTMDEIFLEKSDLYRSVVKNSQGRGVFVVNADDKYLSKLERSKGLTTYGEESGDVKITLKNNEINLLLNSQKVLISNKNILEKHNLKNLTGTFLFCQKMFPEFTEKLILAAGHYEQPSMNRSQWVENIFLDAYNANPSSMEISLKSFCSIMNDKSVSLNDCYFVLGDMNELGEHAPEMHREIALLTQSLGLKNITFLGRYREHYLKGAPKPTSHYLTKEEFYEEWKKIRKSYKYIFIKASRSLQLETLMSIV